MKITIDEKVCLKHKMTIQEVLLALAIKTGKLEDNLENMVKREILVDSKTGYLVTQHWSDVLDEIICDSSSATDRTEEQLISLAQKMRDAYPQGKMPGTAYYYRCNNKEVILKLKKFFLTYDKYSDDEIIEATKRFVSSFNGNYKYLPLIKYFISKLKPIQEEDGTIHNVEYSPLADYLENKEESGGVEVNTSDDWLMNSRN